MNKIMPALQSASTFFIDIIKMTVAGFVWLTLPSIIIFMISSTYGVPNPYASATNAFVFWILIHILVLVLGRALDDSMIRKAIEEYHNEYVIYRNRYLRFTNQHPDAMTLKTLKENMQ